MHDLRTGPRVSPALAMSVFLFAAGCGGDASSDAPGMTRDTLPDGTVVVRYPTLPIGEPLEVVADLRLGSVEGDPHLSFADIRGIDAGKDGTIYVLDYQASEVRAFNADGAFLRLVATIGEGPGEIRMANGMILVGDSILWISDPGNGAMIGVNGAGEELDRYPRPAGSYGYVWEGTVDRAGRLWRPEAYDDEPVRSEPELGLVERSLRRYLKWYDPSSNLTDSIYVGEHRQRTYISESDDGGHWGFTIEFDPRIVAIVNPDGGFWHVHTSTYRIARLDERGDTVLVIEAAVRPSPVTDADRSDYVERWVETAPETEAGVRAVADLMPDVKPVIDDLLVDDRGRLWVRRVVSLGEMPLYDIFDPDGTYLGSHRLGFEPSTYVPMRIRGERLYALIRDELDIPFVVRAELPVLREAMQSAASPR